MSRSDETVDRSLLSTFRDRLEEIGVASTVVTDDTLTDELEQRLEYPVISSLSETSLPADVIEQPTDEDLRRANTGVTPARLGVASHGSVVISSNAAMDGPISLYPPKHIAVLDIDDIVPDIGTALETLAPEFADGENDVVFVTGPSSTGDMGELVIGVHGPAEMEVMIVT